MAHTIWSGASDPAAAFALAAASARRGAAIVAGDGRRGAAGSARRFRPPGGGAGALEIMRVRARTPMDYMMFLLFAFVLTLAFDVMAGLLMVSVCSCNRFFY